MGTPYKSENMIDMKLMSNRLQELAEKEGMSLTKIAKKAHVSEMTLYRIANGSHKNITAETVIRIAVYFGVSADYILGLTDTP